MYVFTDAELPLQRIYRWEREQARKIFLTQPFGGGNVRDWTWAEAVGEARRIATYLKNQNWEPGTHVAILSKNCAWWVMADMAIWMAGHVSVPIYPTLKGESICQILQHSDARACFIGAVDEKAGTASMIPAGVQCIRFPTATVNGLPGWDAVASGSAPLTGNPVREENELATIIYTSGTTGLPKGVMHSFSGLRHVGWCTTHRLGEQEDQRFLSYLPLAHILERGGVEMAAILLARSRIYFTEGLETFLNDLKRAQPTIFLSVPRVLLKLQQGVFAKAPKQKLDRLFRIPLLGSLVKKRILRQIGLDETRHAASGAAPLPVDTLQWYRNLGLDLAEGYGMTETMITHLPMPGNARPGWVGIPFEGVECKAGENSELLVKSPMNTIGYYKDPQATSQSFTPDGYFRTGDIVDLEPNGELRIVGRLKEQFKTSRGKYVAPAPIEGRLVAHPAVEACCVMGSGQPNPFAIVLLSPEAREQSLAPDSKKTLEHSLREQLEKVNAQLETHERLKFIAIAADAWTVGNGLLTPTMKIKRGALENRYQSLISAWETTSSSVVWESAS
jgi:long-chain acyl-CoA synthetase